MLFNTAFILVYRRAVGHRSYGPRLGSGEGGLPVMVVRFSTQNRVKESHPPQVHGSRLGTGEGELPDKVRRSRCR